MNCHWLAKHKFRPKKEIGMIFSSQLSRDEKSEKNQLKGDNM